MAAAVAFFGGGLWAQVILGGASALLGTLQFVLASASSALVAGVADGTARPMTGCMALFSVLSLLISRFVVKRNKA